MKNIKLYYLKNCSLIKIRNRNRKEIPVINKFSFQIKK